MARTKKEPTAACRLAAALVPAAEPPYAVPANWQWVRLGSLITLLRGVSYKKADVHLQKQDNDCLIMRGGNILEGKITLDADNVFVDKSLVDDEQIVKENDVVIVASTGSVKVIGRAGIVDRNYADVAFGAFLMLARPMDTICKTFVDFYFQTDLYRNRIKQLVSGININNIRAEHITNAPVPLPPRAEQARIVARVEELFGKLDEAETKIRAALETFARRRAALLRAAFTGRLTAAWRTAHSATPPHIEGDGLEEKEIPYAIPANWQWVRLGNLVEVSTEKTENFSNPDIKYVGLENMQKDGGIMSYGSVEGIRSTKNVFHAGQILYGKLRPYLNKHDIAKSDGVCSTDILVFSAKANADNRFVNFFLGQPQFISFASDNSKGINLPRVSAKVVISAPVPLPPLDEQREIVRVLDEALAREDAARAAAEAALAEAARLRRAILARAFRGGLGTGDPADPPALPAD